MTECCDNCSKEGASKRCSKCRSVFYCDRDCQISGWKGGHKKICSVFTCITNIPSEAGGGSFVLAAGCYKDNLVMIRGVEDKDRGSECWTYNIADKEWTLRNVLPYHIHSAAMGVVVQNYIYLLRFTRINILLLRIDLEKEGDNNCEELAALEGIRAGSSIATDGESFIYLSGGYIPNIQNPIVGRTNLSSVDRYDIARNEWERNWSEMPTPRYDHSSVIANDCLYVFGGRNEVYDLEPPTPDCRDPTQQMPICNLRTKEWWHGSPLPFPASNFTIVHWGGRFLIPFTIGKCTVVYDTFRDKWNLSRKLYQKSLRFDPKHCVLSDGKVLLLGGMKALRETPDWCDEVTAIDISEIIKTCELDWNRS
jgi:hypothetical protein